jgi:hypothetical protein
MSRQADAEREFLTAPLVALSASFALGIVVADAPRASLAGTLVAVPLQLCFAGACMLAGLTRISHRKIEKGCRFRHKCL